MFFAVLGRIESAAKSASHSRYWGLLNDIIS